ncbi:MAG TPA: hypothetical protein IAC24_03415 [Candidatus Onthousia faecigallinarum]|nr:hypothetical protein [Candidatus Onthousia faecigallinarum]
MRFLKENYCFMGIMGFLLAILGSFLPFYTMKAGEVTLSNRFIDQSGMIVVVLSFVGLFLLFFKDSKFFLWIPIFNLVITLFDGINDLISFRGNAQVDAYLNIGFFLVLIGSFFALMYAILLKDKSRR